MLKVIQILCTVCKFCDLALFSSTCFCSLIRGSFGRRFGSFWTLKTGHLGSTLAQSCLQERSKRLPESCKRLSREGSKRPPSDLQAAKTTPRALKEAPGAVLASFWAQFGSIFSKFRAVLEKCLKSADAQMLSC